MTAEVSVMNRNGVALAADSAVTVGHAAGKVYTSAEKLFQLADNAPVGIMIYGNVGLLRLPWETIVKMYRAGLRGKVFPRLTDYADNFTRFLVAKSEMIAGPDQEGFLDFIAKDFYSYIRKNLFTLLERKSSPENPLEEAEIKRIFADLVHEEIGRTKGEPKLVGLPRNIVEIIKKRYRTAIVAASQEVFERLPMSQLTARRLFELVPLVLTCRRLEARGLHSGVVIAGFGEREHYPTLIEIKIYGMIAGYPLFWKENSVEVGKDADACVAPFAQNEMVWTFLHGIDPNLRSMIDSSTISLFQRASKILVEEVALKYPRYGKSLEKRVNESLSKLLSELREKWDEVRHHDYSDPVMEMVTSLPKDELGAMAESLVNLTKFKRRVSKEQETVGGPIDVAVIT